MQRMLQELVDYASKMEGEIYIQNICADKPSRERVVSKLVDDT